MIRTAKNLVQYISPFRRGIIGSMEPKQIFCGSLPPLSLPPARRDKGEKTGSIFIKSTCNSFEQMESNSRSPNAPAFLLGGRKNAHITIRIRYINIMEESDAKRISERTRTQK